MSIEDIAFILFVTSVIVWLKVWESRK